MLCRELLPSSSSPLFVPVYSPSQSLTAPLPLDLGFTQELRVISLGFYLHTTEEVILLVWGSC